MTYIQGVSRDRRRATLRGDAEQLIQGGTAPSVGGGTLGVDALELLYRRASNPEFAADAVKLLHELQTHQVELDLLFEQLQSSEAELADELAHYRALYNQAPVPYLIVNTAGVVVERNRAAIALFGHRDARLAEHQLYDLLASSSRAAVGAMMDALGESQPQGACVVELAGGPGDQDYFTMRATLGPSDDLVLVTLQPTPVAPNS